MIGISHNKKLDPSVKKNDDTVMQTFMIHRPIYCKKHEFSRETWWMIDLENYNGDQGATGLMKRCMKAYGWNNVDSVKEILRAYRQFLTLKSELDTTTIGAMMWPSYLVDQMWHQHSLDHETYCHDTRMLYGRPILRNPDQSAKLDAAEATKQGMQARYYSSRTRTKAELVKRFGLENLNREVWGWLKPHTTDESFFQVEDESQGGEGEHNNDDISWDSGDYLPPPVRDKRRIPSFISYNNAMVETDTTLSDVSDSLDDNLSEQKKKNERVLLRFIMRATGGKVEVAARPKKALEDVFKMYAQHIQRDLKDLRFTIHGKPYDSFSQLPVAKLKIVQGNSILVDVHDNSKANRKCTMPVNN